MTRADLIWDGEVHDCSQCTLTLLDAMAFATDADIFEVNYRTGATIDGLVALQSACKDVRRRESGFRFDVKPDSLSTLTLPNITI